MASGMTKTALVRNMAEKLEVNNKQAATFLQTLADTALKETKKNGVFVIPGLGRLVKSNRKARVGRNPQTGEPAFFIARDRISKFGTEIRFFLKRRVRALELPTTESPTQRGYVFHSLPSCPRNSLLSRCS